MSKSEKKTGSKKEPERSDIENTGNYLRTLRLGKGLSIHDVSEATRISQTNLNAIEDQDFASLPASTFTRGLLNIYVKFLDAENAETIVTKFMEERESSAIQKRRSRQTTPSRKLMSPKRLAEPAQMSSMTMAGILLLFIVVSFIGYCLYTSWNPFGMLMQKDGDMRSIMESVFHEEKQVTDFPADEEITMVSEKQAPLEPLTPLQPSQETEKKPSMPPGETTAQPAVELNSEQKTAARETKYTLTIHFLQDTAIELTKDNDETVVKQFRAGDLQSWSAEDSITMTFTKADSAEIQINNVAVPFPEARDGHYTLRIPQDAAEQLPQDE